MAKSTKPVKTSAARRSPAPTPKASAAAKPFKSSKSAPVKADPPKGKPVAMAAKGPVKAPAKPVVAAKEPAAKSAAKVPVVAKGPVAVKATLAQPASAAKKVNGIKPAAPAPAVAPVVIAGATKSGAKVAVEVKPGKADRPRNGTPPAPALPPRPIPEAVPTDGKPRKNQAGLGIKELEHFRDLLLAKRRELVGDMVSMESEALRTSGGTNLSNLPLHMADMGTDNYEQEFTLGLVEKDRNLLREINGALAKIQNGTYGICEGTQQPISKVRLEAQPWARFSIEHARSLERRIR